MKAIAITGTRGFIENTAFMPTNKVMQAVGNNTGNLVFQYAVYNMITEPKLIVGQDISWDPKAIRDACRAVVVPSANFIRENFDMTGYVDFLEKTELPLIFLGIGAQAENYTTRDFDFHPSIQRLLGLIRERSKKVAVRGYFTAELFEKFGINHVEVTGCPSNFINQSPDFADMIEAKLAQPLNSFITHGDEPWPKNMAKQPVERRLCDWTMKGNSFQSQQSVPIFMEYIRRNNTHAPAVIPEGRENALHRALLPDAPFETFQEFINARMRVYLSVSQWMEDSARFDFSVGLRLHGNMVAWQAGTPALWIHHDSRTRELSEIMALPSIDFETFLEQCTTIEEARQKIEFDKHAYRTQRRRLAERMHTVLDSEKISNSLTQTVLA
ncbi:MAG: polysaccharide pyruvyl transferase family protein [Asticcacaulis sp.]